MRMTKERMKCSITNFFVSKVTNVQQLWAFSRIWEWEGTIISGANRYLSSAKRNRAALGNLCLWASLNSYRIIETRTMPFFELVEPPALHAPLQPRDK
mmetsp:Transcript_18082/g.41841  ORF Transcript_18082/g.41841 Transcript_18082/m.41841 type:complete len:98 (+) Transcript_18082:1291-1584(+)